MREPNGSTLYQVICTGVSDGVGWRTPISVHDCAGEAVLAASRYRSMYRRNFGPANPHRRNWSVERIRMVPAFEVPGDTTELFDAWALAAAAEAHFVVALVRRTLGEPHAG